MRSGMLDELYERTMMSDDALKEFQVAGYYLLLSKFG